MTSKARKCESSSCFDVKRQGDTVCITGIYDDERGVAIDTLEAWLKFRQEVKDGLWDHVGGES